MTLDDLDKIRNLLIADYEAEGHELQDNLNAVQILIADNDTKTRESLHKLLASQPDFEVIGIVSNGYEAIEFATAHHPKVILIDSDLPDIDGFATTKQIVSILDDTSIITISTKTDNDTMQNAMLSGACFVLSKPLKTEQTVTIVRTVAKQYKSIRTDTYPITDPKMREQYRHSNSKSINQTSTS